MKGRDANKLCPCGSSIKYKNCYGKSRSDCSLYMSEYRELLISQHQEKEPKVFKFFTDAVEEVQRVFLSDGCDKIVYPRLQCICAFTLAEVLSNYWDSYRGKSQGPNDRLHEWFSTFCFTSENGSFTSNRYFSMIGIEPLLELRHSLIHFLGLSAQKKGKQLGIVSSDMDDVTFEKVKSRLGKDLTILKPKDLYNLFKDGASLMLKEMKQNIHPMQPDEERKWQHVEGIHRIHEKIESEGTVMVEVPAGED